MLYQLSYTPRPSGEVAMGNPLRKGRGYRLNSSV